MGARFDDDTAIAAFDDQPQTAGSSSRRWTARMDRGWWIERGPNGGYVAAVVLRALAAAVADPTRTPRSLTVHYLSPPAEGPVEIDTTVERSGRSMTFVTGRLRQGDRLLAIAMAAFAPPIAGPEFSDLSPPEVPPPEELPPTVMPPGSPHVEMRDRYEMRWAIGAAPFSGGAKAVSGGWIRLADPRPADHLLVAALTDAWMPPLFSRLQERLGVPTIDLTVHFRAPLDTPPPEDWFLVVFRSQMAADGFVEEDGEVWSRDGRLLAHSRQLAITLAP
jgi:acyl-CoA thioesterase